MEVLHHPLARAVSGESDPGERERAPDRSQRPVGSVSGPARLLPWRGELGGCDQSSRSFTAL